MDVIGTGPVFYYNPPARIASGGTDNSLIVEDPYSNPVGTGGSSPADSSVIEIDPQFYLGQSSFLLSAVFNSDNTVSLSWTYPNLKAGFASVPVTATRILVQRSTSTRQTPYGPTGDGPANSWVNTSKYSQIIADTVWETIYDETVNYLITGAPPYPLTASTEDTPPITGYSHVFHYRLFIFLTVTVGPVHLFYEVDWNVITIITPYNLTVTNQTISWDSPSSSELSSLSRLFGNSLIAERAAITYATTQVQGSTPGSFIMPGLVLLG